MSWLGIDFSGDHTRWRATCRRPNVWIAELEGDAARPRLASLVPVQELVRGDEDAFAALVAHLRTSAATAVGIDAPFSLPADRLPTGGRDALLAGLAVLPCAPRPFARGADLLGLAVPAPAGSPPKPMRATERHWRQRGINVRSTLWNGPRSGAPFTVACLTLIARTGLPCWPWQPSGAPLLVEAFPAAQLRSWGLPHQAYDGDPAARARILDGMARRIDLPAALAASAHASADALDAILAAFAGIAVETGRLAAVDASRPDEGWIAVHL